MSEAVIESCLIEKITPTEFRMQCRNQVYQGQTSGICPGYAQANLCILPKEYAFDFLLFCQRNPKPCPLIDVLEAGQCMYNGKIDIRKDIPKYRLYIDGILQPADITDISSYWQDDFVTFIIGCSFSFEDAMIRSGLSIRHIEMGLNRTVPMYNTNIACKSAGRFTGNMVVTMRPLLPIDVVRAVEITSRYPRVHGSPIHIGNPKDIGINDLDLPDYGDKVYLKDGEIPVFWACGVTPQAAVVKSKPSICITHAPGHMLVLDISNDSLSIS